MEIILMALQNLNARKELQPNYKRYCHKLYTVYDCITEEKVISICFFTICVWHFSSL